MDPRAQVTLEYPKVIERVASYALFSASREMVLEMVPSPSRLVVTHTLAETSEARRLLDLVPDFTVRGARDVRQIVSAARIGATAEPQALLDVRDLLEGVAYVRQSITRVGAELPILARRVSVLDPCPGIVRAIRDSISDDGDVLDRASPELARARQLVRSSYSRLMETLRRIVDNAVTRGHAQEGLITMRSGRYVVPIRAHSRNVFRGIVHDESASGATVFMEPLAAVTLNNDWRQAQIQEAKEVERILATLTAMVGNASDVLVANVNTFAAVDTAICRARYASEIAGVEPTVLPDPAPNAPHHFAFLEARHPLLKGTVVPINISLGERPSEDADVGIEKREGERTDPVLALLITGPNTGGKTVALKTAGLLHLMAQAGLHIPTKQGATLTCFENIYADIGDAQSIEQSLSTFSSHMSNIIRVLSVATCRDLVLFDELGVGTDPLEGSALARAIIAHLVERSIPLIATTHYSELKAYAYQTNGVRNASVEFDVATLRPTYRLQMGVPGQSNAIAIAERLGLRSEILDVARGHLDPSDRQIEDVLAGIESERSRLARAREVATRVESEARVRLAHVEQRIAFLDEERSEVLARARAEATALLEDARTRVRRAESAIGSVTASRAMMQVAGRDLQSGMREIASRPAAQSIRATGGRLASEPPVIPMKVGDRVEVRRLGAVAIVVQLPDGGGNAEVQLGTMRMRVHVRDFSPVTRREADGLAGGRLADPEPLIATPRPVVNRGASAQSLVGLELDVRGYRADEVTFRVDQYLNDAYLGSMPWVRIIHGKGTGVLRQIIRDYLRNNPLVARAEAASSRDGGEGATIAHLSV